MSIFLQKGLFTTWQTLRALLVLKNKRAGGVPQNYFHPKSYFYVRMKTDAKFQNPYDNPFWEKSNPSRKKKETLSSVTALASRSDKFLELSYLQKNTFKYYFYKIFKRQFKLYEERCIHIHDLFDKLPSCMSWRL